MQVPVESVDSVTLYASFHSFVVEGKKELVNLTVRTGNIEKLRECRREK